MICWVPPFPSDLGFEINSLGLVPRFSEKNPATSLQVSPLQDLQVVRSVPWWKWLIGPFV